MMFFNGTFQEDLLNGSCNVFAYQLSLMTGLPMAAYLEERMVKTSQGLTVQEGLVHMFCVIPYENNNETIAVDAFGFKTLPEIVSEYKITDAQKLVYFHPGNHSVLDYGYSYCFENLGVLLPKVKDYILENFPQLTKDYYAPTPC
jgi:hypothetical protein